MYITAPKSTQGRNHPSKKNIGSGHLHIMHSPNLWKLETASQTPKTCFLPHTSLMCSLILSFGWQKRDCTSFVCLFFLSILSGMNFITRTHLVLATLHDSHVLLRHYSHCWAIKQIILQHGERKESHSGPDSARHQTRTQGFPSRLSKVQNQQTNPHTANPVCGFHWIL